MSFLDDVSAGLGKWSRSSLNLQFGGGCPLCKGDNTLDRKEDCGKTLLVCEKCGAAFDNAFFKGLKLVAGDRRYLDQTLPVSVWRLVRLLSAEDCLLASYSEGSVRFFATDVGVIRVKNSAAMLKYSDITAVSLATAWVMSIYHIALVLLFFIVGIAAAVVGSALDPIFGLIYPIGFFFMGSVLLFVGRREVFRFDSPILSSSERRLWHISKLKSKDAKGFVSLVREHLAKKSS